MSKSVVPSLDVTHLGQVFTPDIIVETMLRLRRNHGRVLEPAAGNGAFSRKIENCVAIEPDSRHAPAGALVMDFFAYPETESFTTIIGNPPYVRYQDICLETAQMLRSQFFDGRSNLYLFFIEKAIRHLAPGGELIFITPRDFLKATSSVRLNRWLYQQGSITDAIELGDTKVFEKALPNCLIWRFEKNRVSRETRYAEIGYRCDLPLALANLNWEGRVFTESDGHLMFVRSQYDLLIRDLFAVKVGAVSGADKLYAHLPGNREFVCSETLSTGRTRRMLWQAPGSPVPDSALLPYKAKLMARRIRHFDESNWWNWGRGYPETDAPRIYVNSRTRRPAPFFLHSCPHFDGSVLALFPHDPKADLEYLCRALNRVDWNELGFVCDGRFIFTQRSLENAPLPLKFTGV